MNEYQSQLNNSVAQESSSKFNIKAEGFHKAQQQKQKQFQQVQTDEIEKKVSEVIEAIKQLSKGNTCMVPLNQQLCILKPIMDNLSSVVQTINPDTSVELYQYFRNIFKQFNTSVRECGEMSLQSKDAKSDPQKIQEILKNITNVSEKMKVINQKVNSQNDRYLVWVDFNESIENKQVLLYFQNLYGTSLCVKSFHTAESFKKCYEEQLTGRPIFLILSGQAANDAQPSDGRLFSWIRDRWNNDKSNNLIRSLFIYCSNNGLKYVKDKLMNDPSKLVQLVTCNTEELMVKMEEQISPCKFQRIILYEDLGFLISEGLRNKLFKFKESLRNSKSLMEYHPDKINLQGSFDNATKLIKFKNIDFKKDASNFNNVLQNLRSIYAKHESEGEKQLAIQIIRLYTQEKSSFFQMVNTALNMLNEQLFLILMPLIELTAKALYEFDDSSSPKSLIKADNPILYRGTSIPEDNFKDVCKQNEIIVLPSFSSFTSDIKVAHDFMFSNDSCGIRYCLFQYVHTKTTNDNFRPKYLGQSSAYQGEEEYLHQPFTLFKIIQIVECKNAFHPYVCIKLTIN